MHHNTNHTQRKALSGDLATIRQAAEVLDYEEGTLRIWARDGKWGAKKHSGKWYFRRSLINKTFGFDVFARPTAPNASTSAEAQS